jgi:hypothetical protein
LQSKPKPSQPKNPEPKLDASNGILVAFLKVALDWESYQAAGPRHPDDPPEGYRSWTWAEVVEECGWSGAWLAGARCLAEELHLIPPSPKARRSYVPEREVKPAPEWAPPPEPPPRPPAKKRPPANWSDKGGDK